MNISPTAIPGVLLIQPIVHADARGCFQESFNVRRFEELTGRHVTFVQENRSCSKQNVVRGLHYQLARPQAKLLSVAHGEIFDVVVDLRKASPTFGKWSGIRLSAASRTQLWIAEGCAHGFAALSDTAEVVYRTTDYWAPEDERCIAWNDAVLGIEWPIAGTPILSEKDQAGVRWLDAAHFS